MVQEKTPPPCDAIDGPARSSFVGQHTDHWACLHELVASMNGISLSLVPAAKIRLTSYYVCGLAVNEDLNS